MSIENPTIATAKESEIRLGNREKSGAAGGRSLRTHTKTCVIHPSPCENMFQLRGYEVSFHSLRNKTAKLQWRYKTQVEKRTTYPDGMVPTISTLWSADSDRPYETPVDTMTMMISPGMGIGSFFLKRSFMSLTKYRTMIHTRPRMRVTTLVLVMSVNTALALWGRRERRVWPIIMNWSKQKKQHALKDEQQMSPTSTVVWVIRSQDSNPLWSYHSHIKEPKIPLEEIKLT